MTFDTQTNVLSSYLCSLQVYIQEFGMHMRHLLRGHRARERKNEEACLFFKKELLSYLQCSFSIWNNIKNFEKFSS